MGRKRKKQNEIPIKESLPGRRQAVYTAAFWGMAAIIFISPFFRGLFFSPQQYKALIAASIVFWLAWFWKYKNGDGRVFAGFPDYLAAALPVAYLIPVFTAANAGMAVDEVLKNILYFMIFWSTSRLVTGKEQAVKIFHFIYLAGVGLALAGLMTATGLVHINDGFLNGRIYSSLQYPNALASYLIASLFMGLYLWQANFNFSIAGVLSLKRRDLKNRLWYMNLAPYFYAVCTFLISAALVGTKSNGGFLVLFVTLLLYFLALRGPDKFRVFAHLFAVMALAVPAGLLFTKYAQQNSPLKAWLCIMAGIALAKALQFVTGLLTAKGLWLKMWDKRLALAAAAAAAIIIAGVISYHYIAANQEAVGAVMKEFRLRNATERLYFYSDAMKMFKERPLAGWGGGGWHEAYRAYQGYLYSSTQIHSYYIQVLVEAGIIGLLTVAGIWAGFLYLIYALYRKNKADNDGVYLTATIFTAFLAVAGHAAIDFNLSLSALALVLFALVGTAYGLNRRNGTEKHSAGKKAPAPAGGGAAMVLVTAFSLVVIFIAGSFASAGMYLYDASGAAKNGDIKTATTLLKKASARNPFNDEYSTKLADILVRQGRLDEAAGYAEKAVAQGKYEPGRFFNLGIIYLNTGRTGDAVAMAEKALQMAPFDIKWYNSLANMYVLTGYDLMSAGKDREAGEILTKGAQINERIQNQLSKIGPVEKSLWNVAPMLAPSDYTNLYSGASYCLLGEYDRAEPLLKAVSGEDNAINAESLLWQALIAKRRGDTGRSNELIARAKELYPDAEKQFSYIFSIINK